MSFVRFYSYWCIFELKRNWITLRQFIIVEISICTVSVLLKRYRFSFWYKKCIYLLTIHALKSCLIHFVWVIENGLTRYATQKEFEILLQVIFDRLTLCTYVCTYISALENKWLHVLFSLILLTHYL